MSNESQYYPAPTQVPPAPSWPPVAGPKKTRKFAIVATSVAALLVGGAIGAAVKPAPEPVVRVETKTETKEVKVPITLQSCLDALNSADGAFGLFSEQMGNVAEAFKASQSNSVVAMNVATGKLQSVNSRLDTLTPQYVSAKTSCRAGR